MSLVEYDRVADARSEIKHVLDVAADGSPVTVRREGERFAVVDAARLRYFLASIGPRAQVVAEDGGWSLFFPSLPIAAEGDSLNEAFDDAVVVLREYAEDWVDHLRTAPNHAKNWGLVQLVSLSSDEELRAWLIGTAGDLARSES
jgi:predicted RNase H-like HicB family nuclease